MIELVAIFAGFLILLAAGMPVPFSILVTGMVYLFSYSGWGAFDGLGLISWASLDNFILTAIPFFILMAELLQASGLTARAYRGLVVFTSRIPGRLLQANIAGCALFAAVSGSSIVTAASIGSVALPELLKRNYDRKLSVGSIAAGGTLGILVPPSIVMIIYSSFTETSIVKLFMAGVVPGILLTLMFMIYIAVHAVIDPKVVGDRSSAVAQGGLLKAAGEVLPLLVLIVLTMGSMYLGIVTPTEAAAIGCGLAIAASLIWGSLRWRDFFDCIARAVLITGNILFIVYAAYVFSHAMSLAGEGEKLTQFIVDLNLNRTEFLFALTVLYSILGCLVESVGMIVVTVPLLYPILPHFGMDPIWFGVVVAIFIELGQVTPPIGINLFVIQSIWKGKLSEIAVGTIPFHVLMLLLLILLMIWPEIALWLPSHM